MFLVRRVYLQSAESVLYSRLKLFYPHEMEEQEHYRFCYIICILRKAQSVVFFKTFVNFAVSHGMYFRHKSKRRMGKKCYLSQCLAVRMEKTADSGAL